jgi:glycosyltransferase involved in cell wall biosynthesis
MLFSVAICTRDRSRMLRRALDSLVACDKPHQAWELLVVDNGSKDDTGSVVGSFAADLPVRLIREENAGLSNARNRAVREARGEWILWIDDDVTVARQWLVAYARAVVRHTDAGVFGGPIDVRLEGSPPPWLTSGMHWVLDAYAGRSDTDFRGRFHAVGPKPYGANFALRRSVALRFPFDPALGHHPLRPTMGGEETAVIASALSGDSNGWWVPAAKVTHHIDRARQSIDYLRSYYVDAGRLSAVRRREARVTALLRLSVSVLRAIVNQARYLALQTIGEEHHRVRRLRDAAWNWGYVKGYAIGLGGPLNGSVENVRHE